MGYYIETPRNHGKAKQLVDLHGGEIVQRPASFGAIPAGKALICVVDNNLFEAAGLCYSSREFEDFSHDTRRRWWVLLDAAKAHELSGYTQEPAPDNQSTLSSMSASLGAAGPVL